MNIGCSVNKIKLSYKVYIVNKTSDFKKHGKQNNAQINAIKLDSASLFKLIKS